MSIGMKIKDRLHFCVKENLLAMKLRIIDLRCKGIHDPLKALCHFRESGHTIQLCVCFKYMKQGIHRLICDDAVLRKLVVLNEMEFLIERFQISDFIGTFIFNNMIQLFGNI